MTKLFYLLFVMTFISVRLFSQILPSYLTEEEKLLIGTYVPFADDASITNPPSFTPRTMAEWEELQGILITWRSFPEILAEIVDYAQDEGMVYIVCNDSNSVKSYLRSMSIPEENIAYLVLNSNSIWCRDYGPWSIYADFSDSLSFVDWIYNRPRPFDDQIPLGLGNYLNIPVYRTLQNPYDLVHTGGNFMTDGHGTGFSSELVLTENPNKTEEEIDSIMSEFMGIDRFVKMEKLPYDVIHHIDMHMKLLDEETLLVGEYPPGIADGPQIEANLQYVLNNFKTCFGRDYNVVRIPMPPDQSGRYPNNNGDYRTYTNSLIVNKTVIIPTYEEKYDTTAMRIYREAMPGYRVVGIECNDIIPLLGTIHCITKEIGAADPIFISHMPIRSVEDLGPYPVEAFVSSSAQLSGVKLFWSADTSSGFESVDMSPFGADSFAAAIPAQESDADIFYYLEASTNEGKSVSKPLTAPHGWYRFKVPIILSADEEGSISEFKLFQNYPNPFNPATVIEFSLPERSFVTLKIYDALGGEIAALISEELNAGQYAEYFEPNSFAAGLSSGIYIYKLTAGKFSSSGKMIYLK